MNYIFSDFHNQFYDVSFRHEKMKKFLKAIHRPTRSNLAPIKIKDIFKLELIDQIFDKLV